MQDAVRFQIRNFPEMRDGDVIVANHPACGGSHLPDITVITPVFHDGKIIFFVASRGHHADIGGISPGSMPSNSTELWQEGAAITGFKIVEAGVFQEKGITELLMAPGKYPGCSGSRNLADNLSDLRAQVAANHRGITLCKQLIAECGLRTVHAYMEFIRANAENAVRELLKQTAAKYGPRLHAKDFMDDGSPIELTVTIDPATGSATFDFSGTGPEVYGNFNAPLSITYSATLYTLRAMLDSDIPLNQGCLGPVTFYIPSGCLLSPSKDAAVVGGNVMTSQRVVDVVLRAFNYCAASQGDCNNLTFGNDSFGYYETIAGGAGAGPGWHGRSGVHTHMTNTRITDPEILERRYPVVLRQFSLRKGSGGAGKWRGGDGVVRELEFTVPLQVSVLTERRVHSPYGLAGGHSGEPGRNLLIKGGGDGGKRTINLGGKCTVKVEAGDTVMICTPGAGGYGAPDAAGGGNGDDAMQVENNEGEVAVPYLQTGSYLKRKFEQYSN
ncbi:hypothetical protein H9P43_004473 [Blastocladiella emersonii ATCC 22665]|nr:hypothetical protein H9P43_004473 [Blastocladiella emersonii ATCC 22665]